MTRGSPLFLRGFGPGPSAWDGGRSCACRFARGACGGVRVAHAGQRHPRPRGAVPGVAGGPTQHDANFRGSNWFVTE
jgi:hypothetical protein